MTTTKNLVLTHLVEGQQNAATAVNSLANIIDALAQGVAINETNTPPGSPGEGDTYIVGTAPTGAWASNAEDIAINLSGWVFVNPNEGWTMYEQTNNVERRWDGANWVDDHRGAAIVSLTNSTGGSTDDDVSDVGASFNQTTLNNNFAEVTVKINDLITRMETANLLAP